MNFANNTTILSIWAILGPIVGSGLTLYGNYKVEKFKAIQEEKKIISSQYPQIRLEAEQACRKFLYSTNSMLSDMADVYYHDKGKKKSINRKIKNNFTISYEVARNRYNSLNIFLQAYTGKNLGVKINENITNIKGEIDRLLYDENLNNSKRIFYLKYSLEKKCNAFPAEADMHINKEIISKIYQFSSIFEFCL